MRAERATTRRERRGAGRSLLLAAGLVVAALVLFWIGIAVGRVLAETPDESRLETRVRTLEPGTLEPVTRTVTVTTAAG